MVLRRLHRQFAQELAARISLSTDSPASVPSRSAVGHRTVSRSRRPRRLKGISNSSVRPESGCRPLAEVSSVQALMELSLPRFAGLGDGPRQVHPPWSIASVSPASPATGRQEVKWTRCQCRRHVSTWICCLHRRRMIRRIRLILVTCQLHCFVTQRRPVPLLIPIRSSQTEISQKNQCQRTRDR